MRNFREASCPGQVKIDSATMRGDDDLGRKMFPCDLGQAKDLSGAFTAGEDLCNEEMEILGLKKSPFSVGNIAEAETGNISLLISVRPERLNVQERIHLAEELQDASEAEEEQ